MQGSSNNNETIWVKIVFVKRRPNSCHRICHVPILLNLPSKNMLLKNNCLLMESLIILWISHITTSIYTNQKSHQRPSPITYTTDLNDACVAASFASHYVTEQHREILIYQLDCPCANKITEKFLFAQIYYSLFVPGSSESWRMPLSTNICSHLMSDWIDNLGNCVYPLWP